MKIDSLLIVDDDYISSTLTTMLILERYAHTRIKVSSDGKKALEEIKDCLENNEHCPDIIFLDVHMPVMDGLEFLEKLKEFNKNNLPIIMLTCGLLPQKDELIKNHNIMAVIEKPLTEEKLEQALLKLIVEQ